MKILKKVLVALVAVIAVFLIVALIAPKKYAVEREVIINNSPSEVFQYIKMLKNQDRYSSWATMDPGMKKQFQGTDGTVGFISAWESDNKDVGSGEQEIMKIVDGERIDYELRFFEPFEAIDHAYLTTEKIGDYETIVKWGFNGKMDYPFNVMLLFMNMEEMLGDDLQKGLDKLKILLEEK